MNTLNSNDLKMSIINLITKIDNIEKLKLLKKSAEQLSESLDVSLLDNNRPDFKRSTVEIDEGVSFQELLDEQNYKPISYQEFRELADQIEWEHSLEELLEALD